MLYQILLLCTLLFSISPMHAMDTLPDLMDLPNDIIIYNLGARLNRPTKNAFRLTNKKHSQLIIRQVTLNKNYAQAYTSQDIEKMVEWRKRGGLHNHEEVYNLFMDRQNLPGVWLTRQYGPAQFCVLSLFSHGVTQNNKEFIQWLLDKYNPVASILITNSIALAKKLGHSEITQLLEYYDEPLRNIYRGGGCGGPPRE